MQHWNRMPDALKEQVFNRLEELASVANLSLEDRIAYDKALDRYRVSRIVEEDAREAGWKKGLEEGRAEGLIVGRAEGHAEGLAVGRAEGRAEGHAEGHAEGLLEGKKSVVSKLNAFGLSIEQIKEATGLTEKDIRDLLV